MNKVLRICGACAALAVMLGALVIAVTMHSGAHAASLSTKPASTFALEHIVNTHSVGNGSLPVESCGAGATGANLLINVTEGVTNDADSGQGGNYWALDAFSRTIKVWQMGGDDTYCAVVTYNGTWAVPLAGLESPGMTTTLKGTETGTIKGGATYAITGPLNVSNPSIWPLRGSVNHSNAVDYQCVINADGTDNGCPGYQDWVAQYFDESAPSYTLNENPWGWKYVGHFPNGDPAGVWINASTGDSGDII